MELKYTYTIETKDVLLEEIKRHNRLYRLGTPEVSDAYYNAEVDLLKEFDPDNDWFKQLEPAEVSAKRKVSLPIQMKSLNKVKNYTELMKWAKSLGLSDDTEVVCMPKYDGISLLYDESKNKAYSRGGEENEGQDCTAHFNSGGYMAHRCRALFTFGEFMISNQEWDDNFRGKSSPHTGEPYKSQRNTAAGLINRDDPSNLLPFATFYRYGMDDGSIEQFDSYFDTISYLCATHDQPALFQKLSIKQATEQHLMDLFSDWRAEYPIDGVVIYINDLSLWKTIGRHQSSSNPLYAVAYKHPDFEASFETIVKDIAWKVSKAGALKPVVNIEAVDTGDCCMENPTGYNAGWISEHDIAKGAKIIVTRSGGVIPKILSTITKPSKENTEELWDSLTECPACGSATAWNESMVELCCTNASCHGRMLAKMVFFFLTCGAENAGEDTYAKVFNAGYTSIGSVLNISFDKLVSIDGFGESLSNVMLENNRKVMQGIDMATLMHASDCFDGIGKVKAQKILDEMDDETLCSFYQGWFKPSWIESECSKTMSSFYKGVEPFYELLADTKIPILKLSKKTVNQDGKFFGKSVCFSGFRDAELEKAVTSQGGSIASGVSKNTSILVVKDKNASSGKISKALAIGVKVVGIEEFKEMI